MRSAAFAMWGVLVVLSSACGSPGPSTASATRTGSPLATAGRTAGGTYSVFPRVVATVMALEPRGLAAIRTREGATYEVLKGTTWRIGDTVERM